MSPYYNASMLENPWEQLIAEFDQSDASESREGPELIKPTDIQFGTIRDKAFSRIQEQNQDIIQTPLSELSPDTIESNLETSPLECVKEIEPYIPSMPNEAQQEEISLADDLISPFGAQESKGLTSLSTNGIVSLESDYEPYIPTGDTEIGATLQPYTPLKVPPVPPVPLVPCEESSTEKLDIHSEN